MWFVSLKILEATLKRSVQLETLQSAYGRPLERCTEFARPRRQKNPGRDRVYKLLHMDVIVHETGQLVEDFIYTMETVTFEFV